mmetsp:Transcript_7803/g.10668  ORF Transcript_7803/g.10668 Transcript_7803/m.10668 type:complete len:191 (-) Transcript_7803:256-828(-)
MFPSRRQEYRRREIKCSSNKKKSLTQPKPVSTDPKNKSAIHATSIVDNQNTLCQATSDMDKVTHLERNDSSRTINSTSDPQIIKKQQHRLLMLRHSTRCNYPPGECPLSRHCAETKLLCQHIRTCKNGRQCPIPHCASSKYILSHYIRCGGSPSCLVCAPVKRAILRSYRKKLDLERTRDLDAKLNTLFI